MKYISYELKKIFGIKYLWIFLTLSLCANAIIAGFQAQKSKIPGISNNEIDAFYDSYFDDANQMEDYYNEIIKFEAYQNKLMAEAFAKGDTDYVTEKWVNQYAPEGFSDRMLFNMLHTSVSQSEGYCVDIQKVIDRAEANLEELVLMGLGTDSYSYKYQLRVISIYKQLRDSVTIESEYCYGWNAYFSYETVNIFIFAVLIMIGSVVFTQERVSGFLPIVRVCRGGRITTALAKLATMGIITIVVVLLFTLTSFGVFGTVLGYSSSENALQVLTEFKLSQYIVSIGEYFILTIVIRLLTFIAFSSVLMLISAVVYNYSIVYVGGAAFFGLNFLLYTLKYTNADSPLKNLNFVATASVTPLCVRFRAVNIFGNVLGHMSFMLTLFSVIILICSVATVMIFYKCSVNGINFTRISYYKKKLYAIFGNIGTHFRNRKKTKKYTQSLHSYEIHKTLILTRYIYIVLALLMLKAYFFSVLNSPTNTNFDAAYKDYMIALEGELNDEKLQYIAYERMQIDETIGKYDQISNQYVQGDIEYITFREYLKSYNEAVYKEEVLQIIEQHRDYLIDLEKNEGIKAWFIYDTGWSRLLNSNVDFYLLASLLLLFAGSFAKEYSSKSSCGDFSRLLRCSKRGRGRTFVAKMMSAVTISLILSIVFNILELAVIVNNYSIPSPHAPLLSITHFSESISELTILQYLLLMYVLRSLASILLSLFMCGLSQITGKELNTLGFASAVTLIPALVSHFGLTAANKINFLNLFSVTPAFTYGGVVPFVATSILIVFICGYVAAKKYIK